MVLASDSEFQEYFAELIRRGAKTLLEFAESKGVQISKEEFWTVIAESLLLVDFALGQREAAGVLWVRVPEVFTFRDLVRFHASSPDQVLVHLARGDARLERVLLLREGRGPIKEPFEGTILANRLRREGRKLVALDCLRDCLAADGTLWELAVKMAHGIQELSPAESRLYEPVLEGWLAERPLSGFPEWYETVLMGQAITKPSIKLCWERAFPHSFLSKWLFKEIKAHFPLMAWRYGGKGSGLLLKLMRVHYSAYGK